MATKKNEKRERNPLLVMEIVRKPFLFCVGLMAVTYEETTKALKTQRERLNERFASKEA